MVKRSEANKQEFLRSRGFSKVPEGFEVDHITPLSEGGLDDPSNMQLITIEEHARKTAKERSQNSSSAYSGYKQYNSSSTLKSTYQYSNPASTSPRTIYTGPNGGEYYINSNGNKTYINSNQRSTSTTSTSSNYPGTKSYNTTRTIYTGPRGGNYYINSNGNKTYIKK